MTIYTPNISRATIASASAAALEMIEDPILILDPDDTIYYCNRAAKDFFGLAENNAKKFDKIIMESDFLTKEMLLNQINLCGKTQGRYVMQSKDARHTVKVFAKELNLQRVIRFAFQKWEPYYLQEKLINRICELKNLELSVEEVSQKILELTFALINVDIAVLSLLIPDLSENPISNPTYRFRPVAVKGIILNDRFDITLSSDAELAFKEGKGIYTDGSEWESQQIKKVHGSSLVLPLVVGSRRIGILRLGAIDAIRLFQSDGDDPATSVEIVDPDFLNRLATYIARALERAMQPAVLHTHMIENVFDALEEGVLLLNKFGEVIYVNEEAKRIVEVGWENINASRKYRLRDANGLPLARPNWPLFRALSEGLECQDEKLTIDFGTHQREISLTVRVWESYILSTVRDITDINKGRLEREEFYGSIAHELRSPITPLKGLLQIVAQRIEKSQPKDFSLLERAQRQVDRLAKLIDDMMDATQIESGNFQIQKERVDLISFFRALNEVWAVQFPSAEISIESASEILCFLDPIRFEQIIVNLIENSIKYCDEKPSVQIKLQKNPVRISMTDNGIGMSDENLRRAFERFYRGHPSRDNLGVGLGLYITKKLVELHGASIEIESKEGKGTCVCIVLEDQE